jgi:hypothetical protein
VIEITFVGMDVTGLRLDDSSAVNDPPPSSLLSLAARHDANGDRTHRLDMLRAGDAAAGERFRDRPARA